MEQGLPNVLAPAVEQVVPRPLALAEPASEPGGEFETAGAAADDDDAMRVRVFAEIAHGCSPAVLACGSAFDDLDLVVALEAIDHHRGEPADREDGEDDIA